MKIDGTTDLQHPVGICLLGLPLFGSFVTCVWLEVNNQKDTLVSPPKEVEETAEHQ